MALLIILPPMYKLPIYTLCPFFFSIGFCVFHLIVVSERFSYGLFKLYYFKLFQICSHRVSPMNLVIYVLC